MKRIEFESSIKFSYLLPKKSDNDLFKNSLLLARGRDALKVLIEDMNLPLGSGVLLPAFACEEIYRPFLDTGLKIHYYCVNQDFTPDVSHIRQMKDDCKVVLVINYFGFLQPVSIYDQLKNWKLLVIEDGSHSFLSEGSGEQGDYYFASLRKLLPVLDGAILHKKKDNLIQFVTLKKSKPLVKFRIYRALGQLIKESDNKKSRRIKQWSVNEMFSNAERNLGIFPSPVRISPFSINILNHLDIDLISRIRRQNYKILREGLGDVNDLKPVFSELPDGVVPYGFPVFAEKRDLWVHALDNLKIQAAPLWHLSSLVPKTMIKNHQLYEQTMLFPVGQDYKEEDMHSLVDRAKSLCYET